MDKGPLEELISIGLKLALLESLWEFEKDTPFSRQMQVYKNQDSQLASRAHTDIRAPRCPLGWSLLPGEQPACLTQQPWMSELRCTGPVEGKSGRVYFRLRNESIQNLQAWQRASFVWGLAHGSVRLKSVVYWGNWRQMWLGRLAEVIYYSLIKQIFSKHIPSLVL